MLSKHGFKKLITRIESQSDIPDAAAGPIAVALSPEEARAVVQALSMLNDLQDLPPAQSFSPGYDHAPATLAAFLSEAIGSARTWNAEEVRIELDVTATFSKSAPEGE